MKQLSQKLSQKIKFRASLKTAESSLPQYFYLVHVIAAITCAGIGTGETCGVVTARLKNIYKFVGYFQIQ